MASVFLSYDREDVARAGTIARALEKAGHSVWWDRHIKGGAQYSKEIEQALKRAHAVVVLWSERSTESAWVRDEAAAGRDSGRLLPVTLDATQPPLGFRQYQAVDFSKWRGRGEPPEMASLLSSISDLAEPGLEAAKPASPLLPRRSISPLFYLLPVLIAVAAGGLVWLQRASHEPAATVIVQPASDDAVSSALARQVSVTLSSLEAAHTGPFRLTTAGPRKAGKSDLLFQVSGANGRTSSSRDLVVLSGANRTILWAGHFEQPNDKAGDLAVQLGSTAARVLSCALDSLSHRDAKLRQETVKLYLTGCAQLAEEIDETSSKVTPLFAKVVGRAPRFAPAWARLLQSEALAVDGTPDSPVKAQLQKHLEQARRLGIEVGAMSIADAALLPSNSYFDRMKLLELGLRRHPTDASMEAVYADWLMRVGRQDDAIEHARRASELDPISPAHRARYILTLAHSGRPEALSELQKAERLWPGVTNIRQARFSYELRYGDPHEALRLVQQGASRWSQLSLTALLKAKIDPTKANIDRAIAAELQLHRQEPQYISGLVSTLTTFGRTREALQALVNYEHPEAAGHNSESWFRPNLREVRRDPLFMQAMANVGLATYWRRSGQWPDFCFEPDLRYDCKSAATKFLQR